LMMYLTGNVQYLNKFLKKSMPEINIIEPEGTFMMWIDFRKWGMSDEELKQFFYKAGVFLYSGVEYGGDSSGFIRINIVCPRDVLEKALNCIRQAYENK
jgi:cystathionine beta-lyase